MDPQACLQRIFDAVAANEKYDCEVAFADLADYLRNGGIPPVCLSLGTTPVSVGFPGVTEHSMPKWEERPRKMIKSPVSNGRYAIISIDPKDITQGFTFAEFSFSGTKEMFVMQVPLLSNRFTVEDFKQWAENDAKQKAKESE